MNAHETLRRKLATLETEGQNLDDVINRLAEMPAFDQLKVQRLKKRRLEINDEVVKLRGKNFTRHHRPNRKYFTSYYHLFSLIGGLYLET